MTLKCIDYDWKEKLCSRPAVGAKDVLAYIRCNVSPSTGGQRNFNQMKSNQTFSPKDFTHKINVKIKTYVTMSYVALLKKYHIRLKYTNIWPIQTV